MYKYLFNLFCKTQQNLMNMLFLKITKPEDMNLLSDQI